MDKGGVAQGRRSPDKRVFLLYHDLETAQKPVERADLATRQTVVRLGEFKKHMDYLGSGGYRVLSVEQYLKDRTGDGAYGKSTVLTFDDGHISNYELALPVLREACFYATFFVIAGRLGKPEYLGREELRELVRSGMEIGSHGLTHSYLTELSYGEVWREVAGSKEILENCAGRPVRAFAFPGGHLTKKIVDCVRKAGYEGAASCIVGRNSERTDPFLLRRIEMRRGTSVDGFRRAMSPSSIAFHKLIDMEKSLLKKTIGLKRYEYLRRKLYHLYPFGR